VDAGVGPGAQGLGQVLRQVRPLGQERFHLAAQQVGHQVALLVGEADLLAEKDQLVGLERDGGRAGHVGGAEVEDLTGGRVADGRHQGDGPVVQALDQRLPVHPAHRPGVPVVHPVEDPQGLGGDEVARGDRDAYPGHGRVGEPHGEQRLDLHPGHPGRLLDAGERRVVGDPQPVHIVECDPQLGEPRLDLRARPVHQDQSHPEPVEQCDVVDQVGEAWIDDRLSAEDDDEGAPPVGMDVGGGVADPVDEWVPRRGLGLVEIGHR
jgi:hypothetical protein